MSIYTEINKAWATLFGFKVENDEASFNDKPLYWNNNAVANWDDLLSAKPSDLKQSAGFAEVPNTKTYDELMTAENFSYGAFEWTNEHGLRIGFSFGKLICYNDANIDIFIQGYKTGVAIGATNGHFDNSGLGFPNTSEDPYASINLIGIPNETIIINTDDQTFGDNNGYFGFYWHQNSDDATYAVILSNVGLNIYENDSGHGWTYASSLPYYEIPIHLYFDDGAHLPEGVEWNEELNSYFVPKVKETETTTILTQTTATQAMLGAQIMTHVSLWGMGIGCACFIIGIFKLFARSLSRR